MNEILNILGSVGFNWHVALANFFNFLIILFLLNKFFFKKIGKTIDTRHQIIERGLNQARDAERALANAEEEKNTIIKNAHKEHESIVLKGEKTAQEILIRMEAAAQTEIDARLEKLSQEEKAIESSVTKAFAEKAPYLVAKLYAKTLMKELTKEDNDALIASMKA
jgi:F-type H+-transporting ATPase subunit b